MKIPREIVIPLSFIASLILAILYIAFVRHKMCTRNNLLCPFIEAAVGMLYEDPSKSIPQPVLDEILTEAVSSLLYGH